MWTSNKAFLSFLLTLACCTELATSQLVESQKKGDKPAERRIIVRYAASDGSGPSLQERVKRLEAIPGVRKAKALPRLDMAVVTCDSEEGEESLLDVLDAHDDVELAVPDTWVSADAGPAKRALEESGSSSCAANPKCWAYGLHSGNCCPTDDQIRLACCEMPQGSKEPGAPTRQEREHGRSTIALQTFHGTFVRSYPSGFVGYHPDKEHEHTQFYVVAHEDGYVSLQTQHGTYLVGDPAGRVVSWTRAHAVADDWEKFRLIYNQDGTVSLRSKYSDKYLAAELPASGVLSCNRDVASDWEKFTVHVKHGDDARIPSDANFSKLWGMDHFGDRDIDAVEAWKIFTGESSKGLVLAVIDTGIDYTHPDLKDQMWVNPNEIPGNGIDDDGNGIIDDIHGADFANGDGDPFDDQMHGTHCAGTIAGRGNNGLGVTGVAWQGVKLMALKFLSADGGGRTSDAVAAMDYAVAMGARLSSNSWGGGGSSSAMRVAIERATAAGMLFIAAAGNEGSDNDEMPHFPSNYASSSIISVAATTYKGEMSSFSCYGKTTVDVGAPGSDIFSTIPGGRYESLSGTSMACPHVSGLTALVWMYRPHLSAAQVKEIIIESSVKQVSLQGTSISNGRINARRALELAATYRAPIPPANGPEALVFEDVDARVGLVTGTATITAAANESDIDYYSLHFISSAGFIMESLGTVNATGDRTLSIKLNGSIAIPGFVQGLAVVAGNADAEGGRETAAIARLEDYGVPDLGPEAVSWGGDSDGRKQYVAGAIQVKRAADESSLSHYNVYWRAGTERGELIGKIPSAAFQKPKCFSCELINQSNASGVYTYHRDAYTDEENAEIHFSGPATVTITHFQTEKYYDYLEIGGQQVTGTDVALPMIIELPAGPTAITWMSDRSDTSAGWTFELRQSGQDAELLLESMLPPSMEVEVVAAYHNYERNESTAGTISDFSAKEMPPSAAFTPRELRFKDTSVSENIISGTAEILPAAVNNDGIVESYRLFLADLEGVQVGYASWSVEFSGNSSTAALVPIATMEVPAGAVQLIARAVSFVGESAFQISVELHDVVRSAPLGASWSGDTDGDYGTVKGQLTILPAANPKGIVSYAIYTAKDTEKTLFLGRSVPTDDGSPMVAELHYYYTQGEGLLVVSAYGDGAEMDDGAYASVTDWADMEAELGDNNETDADSGWWGGSEGWDDLRRLQEQKPKPAEPWLQMSEISQREIFMLWTANDPTASPHKVLGSLTIPGLTTGLVDPSSGELVFMPPSGSQRQALLAALAASLPRVNPDQVKLLKGRVFTGSAAKAQSEGKGRKLSGDVKDAVKRHRASLVVDFEVAADATADAASQQGFLDGVEARLIRLSQGGPAAQRLNSLVEQELVKLGTELPDGGVQALLAEPQQVSPRERAQTAVPAPERGLREKPQKPEVTVTSVFADDDEETQAESSSATLAAVLSVLGAVGVTGCAVLLGIRERLKTQQLLQTEVELEGVSVHMNDPTDQ